MNSFVEKFRQEVVEYLERLESGLLILEKEPQNFPVIDEIFRLMHSMKGSGGMFGFHLLSEVTHDLESLYDLFRSKKIQVDQETISFTLKSIDGLHHLLVQDPQDEELSIARQMKADARRQIDRLTESGISKSDEHVQESGNNSLLDSNLTTYFIYFVPDEDILINGTNPLYLVDELNALGECNIQVSFDRLPQLQDIDPSKCYTSWFLFIATSEKTETLSDVFIFVNRNAQITIEKVWSGNVIHDESMLAGFLNARASGDHWDNENPDLVDAENLKKPGDLRLTEIQPAVEEKHQKQMISNTTVDSVKVDSGKIDQYMNLVSELITAQSRLEEVSLRSKDHELVLVTEAMGKLSRQLRDNAFDMSLIPLQNVIVRFKRLIHDLAKSLDKDVVLVTEGMETELDKNIIEQLLEPLLHIVRNSMDHGIESRAERLKKNKEEVGTILMRASTVGSYVQIEIEDDGAGIDELQIRQKAVEKGLIQETAKVSNQELFQLIFEAGFSTARSVTDVSGRGVGMEVVRRRIREMRGSIELSTEKDKFTRFTIKLPLSLSIIDGLLTVVADNYYVIPSTSIRKIYRVNQAMLKKGFRQVAELEGMQLPYLNLHEEFESDNEINREQFLVAVAHDEHWFGFVVDDVIREYQAVIKPLGHLLKSHDVFSGASILGTGQLALVIDTGKMIQKYS